MFQMIELLEVHAKSIDNSLQRKDTKRHMGSLRKKWRKKWVRCMLSNQEKEGRLTWQSVCSLLGFPAQSLQLFHIP